MDDGSLFGERKGGHMTTEQQFELVTWGIAQAVINIDEGHTTIERGSRVYEALVAFCKLVAAGELQLRERGEHGDTHTD
jgi:hypothetical protein